MLLKKALFIGISCRQSNVMATKNATHQVALVTDSNMLTGFQLSFALLEPFAPLNALTTRHSVARAHQVAVRTLNL